MENGSLTVHPPQPCANEENEVDLKDEDAIKDTKPVDEDGIENIAIEEEVGGVIC